MNKFIVTATEIILWLKVIDMKDENIGKQGVNEMKNEYVFPTKCKTCDGSGCFHETTGYLWWKKKRVTAWCGECLEAGRIEVTIWGAGGAGGNSVNGGGGGGGGIDHQNNFSSLPGGGVGIIIENRIGLTNG